MDDASVPKGQGLSPGQGQRIEGEVREYLVGKDWHQEYCGLLRPLAIQ